ncbi:MAG: hypothetical protein NUW37_03190 [Planctomycetes bacterium]|nr:hypothetical protein [Planctomycetota bacterium]
MQSAEMTLGQPRFSVLFHEGVESPHEDFFIEDGESLFSIKLPPGSLDKLLDPPAEVSGTIQPRHRKLYLDYEGEVSGGRGTVSILCKGTFEAREWTDSNIKLALHSLSCEFDVGIEVNGANCLISAIKKV